MLYFFDHEQIFCFTLYFQEIKKKKQQQKKKLIAKNMKKYLHDRNAQYYIANKCHQFSNLEVIYIAEYTKVIH